MKLNRKNVQPLVAYRYTKDSPRPPELDSIFQELALGEAIVGGYKVRYGDHIVIDEDEQIKVFDTAYIREHFEEEK